MPKHLGPKVKDLLKRIASDTTGGLVEDEKPLMESGDLTPSGPHTWGDFAPKLCLVMAILTGHVWENMGTLPSGKLT